MDSPKGVSDVHRIKLLVFHRHCLLPVTQSPPPSKCHHNSEAPVSPLYTFFQFQIEGWEVAKEVFRLVEGSQLQLCQTFQKPEQQPMNELEGSPNEEGTCIQIIPKLVVLTLKTHSQMTCSTDAHSHMTCSTETHSHKSSGNTTTTASGEGSICRRIFARLQHKHTSYL